MIEAQESIALRISGVFDGTLSGILYFSDKQRAYTTVELWSNDTLIAAMRTPIPTKDRSIPFTVPITWAADDALVLAITLRSTPDGTVIAQGYLDRLVSTDGWTWTDGASTSARHDSHAFSVYEGGVDSVVGSYLFGWARDRTQPRHPVTLDIAIDGMHRQSMVANRRYQVSDSGTATSNGFVIDLTSLAVSPDPVRITVSPTATGIALFDRVLRIGPAVAGVVPGGKLGAAYASWLDEHDVSSPVRARRLALEAQRSTASFSIVILPPSSGGMASQDLRSAWRRTVDSATAVLVGARDIVVPDSALIDQAPKTIRCVADKGLAAMLAMAQGESIIVVTAGDTLSPASGLLLSAALARTPAAAFVYGDEDMRDPVSGRRYGPYFKSGWDIDLALADAYFCRPALFDRQRALAVADEDLIADEDGLYQLLLRLALSDAAEPVHLPHVLYHAGPRVPERADSAIRLAGAVQAIVERAADRHGAVARVTAGPKGGRVVAWAPPAPWPSVSIVIPTRDRIELLQQCVDGLLHETDYPDMEIVIVDNDSIEPETQRYFESVLADPRVRVVPFAGTFDYAAMNNVAVAQSTGAIVALLNNDIKVIGADWLKAMVTQAVRPDVGAVGARLLYGDGLIQHAGISLGIGGVASHISKREAADSPGPNGRLRFVHQVSAVTAACLVIRRSIWDAVGGLSADFPVAYNDVDFCLKVHAAGYRNLMAPQACLYHLESASRGKEDTPEKKARFAADKDRMLDRWADLIAADPFVGPNWSLSSTTVMPAFPPRYAAEA